jgi:hypothetical protein
MPRRSTELKPRGLRGHSRRQAGSSAARGHLAPGRAARSGRVRAHPPVAHHRRGPGSPAGVGLSGRIHRNARGRYTTHLHPHLPAAIGTGGGNLSRSRVIPRSPAQPAVRQALLHASSRIPEHIRQHRIFRDIVARYSEEVSRLRRGG